MNNSVTMLHPSSSLKDDASMNILSAHEDLLASFKASLAKFKNSLNELKNAKRNDEQKLTKQCQFIREDISNYHGEQN